MPAEMSSSNILYVPFSDDPLESFANSLIERHAEACPDLSNIQILLTENSVAAQLRQNLLKAAQARQHTALLGPHILHIRDWARQHTPSDIIPCDQYARELQLVAALQSHPDILGTANPFNLSQDLLSLFDQLTLQHISLPEDIQTFTHQLEQAYGLVQQQHAALNREAQLVHSLWFAWHQQLQSMAQVDPQVAYLLGLTHGLAQHTDTQPLYLLAPMPLQQAEIDWLKSGIADNKIVLVVHGDTQRYRPYADQEPIQILLNNLDIQPQTNSVQSDYADALSRVYAQTDTPLRQRAIEFRQRYPVSPCSTHLAVFQARSDEEEAAAVDLQIRRWLLEGKQQIGIVTENRRLARRVRALLERSAIQLQDISGWALSTTSAAATLERWLECVEEDFAHLPLLDLLKSPFIFPDIEANLRKNAVFRLEQDIILHENIARGLDRYRHHMLERQDRLSWRSDLLPLLMSMLEQLQLAASHLYKLYTGQHPVGRYLHALTESLQTLGLVNSLTEDAAGSRLLQMLEELTVSTQQVDLELDWIAFRHWLGKNLETFNFRPVQGGSPVVLMGLAETHLHRFDAVILAGAEWDLLPGNQASTSPFFNDRVRQELGLTSRRQQLALRFYHYRALLSSANNILLTARKEANGEPVPLSPWLEILLALHTMAYGSHLNADELEQLLQQHDTTVTTDDMQALPQATTRPRVAIPANQLPDTFSPSAYQELINCPYQYFAARCLELRPSEEIRTALSKADYGERVHQCLEAFHTRKKNLPGPFGKKLSTDNRTEAIQLLTTIGQQVFAQDLNDNFAHHGWLQQWIKMIPVFIDWEIERQQNWQPDRMEQWHEFEYQADIKLKGRLDRIDRNSEQLAVLDYKSGAIPDMQDVRQGEYVQLPFYALLADNLSGATTARVEYLQLKDRDLEINNPALEDDDLNTLKEKNAERLVKLVAEIKTGKALPAWGDSNTCGWCEMQSVCRYQTWVETP